MATKGKIAAKAAPVKAAAAVEPDAPAFEVGQQVRFRGYGPDTPEDEQTLVEGEVYEIVSISDPEGDAEGNPVVSFANPDFNPKKKEHADSNPKMLEVEVFPEEIEVVEGEEEEEEVEEETAPAKTKVAAKTAAKAAPAKTAPAKTAPAKTKAVPAKAVKKKEAPKEEEAEEEIDETPDLENEDPDVVAIIENSDDLIATAQDLEQEAGSIEWKLGGVLYHIKKDKSYESLEGGEEYAMPGGFQKFLMEFFNIEYRKAMYLIEIYKHFTLAGITDASARVATMGWTKAKTIAKLLTAEGAKPDELMELADNSTVSDLSTAIKEQVNVGGSAGERKTRITLKFRYYEEEAASIEAILKAAQEALGLKDIGDALSHIVNEWAAANGGGAATKAAAPRVAAKKTAAPAAKRATAKA